MSVKDTLKKKVAPVAVAAATLLTPVATQGAEKPEAEQNPQKMEQIQEKGQKRAEELSPRESYWERTAHEDMETKKTRYAASSKEVAVLLGPEFAKKMSRYCDKADAFKRLGVKDGKVDVYVRADGIIEIQPALGTNGTGEESRIFLDKDGNDVGKKFHLQESPSWAADGMHVTFDKDGNYRIEEVYMGKDGVVNHHSIYEGKLSTLDHTQNAIDNATEKVDETTGKIGKFVRDTVLGR